jgi:ABC-type transporter Mla subunit MlaD
MSYQGLDPLTASNDDRQAAVDDISQAWDNVVDDAYDWANAYDNPLNGAYNDLYDAIDNLPSDYSIAQDLKAVEPQLAAFPQAFHDTFDGTGCQS